MGEMAEMCLSWDMEDVWYNEDIIEDILADYRGRKSRTKTCYTCGKPNLHWVKVDQSWQLFEPNNIQHLCQFSKATHPHLYKDWKYMVPYLRWAKAIKYGLNI